MSYCLKNKFNIVYCESVSWLALLVENSYTHLLPVHLIFFLLHRCTLHAMCETI